MPDSSVFRSAILGICLFSTPGISLACGLLDSTPDSVHTVSSYLRLYPSDALATQNSLRQEDILMGMSDGSHYLYSAEPVSSDNESLRVVVPLWIATSRLDIENGTSGSAGGTVPLWYQPSDPETPGSANSGALTSAANDLPVEFGCEQNAMTLTFFEGYVYRSTALPDYLDYVGEQPGDEAPVDPPVPATILNQAVTYLEDSGELKFTAETQGEFVRRQFLLDNDSDPATGFDGGYDYLLENGIFYSYNGVAGTTDWSWERLDQVVSGNSGDEDVVLWQLTLNDEHTVDMPYLFRVTVTEGEYLDETGAVSGITGPFGTSPTEPANAELTIVNTSAVYDSATDEITINFDSTGDFDRKLVLIDSDDNSETGYDGGRSSGYFHWHRLYQTPRCAM